MRLATGCVNDLMPMGLQGWEKALGETVTLSGASAECPNTGKLNWDTLIGGLSTP